MNIQYTYGNNEVIVTNENGKITKIEYSDNIDDILVYQNIIEDILASIQKNGEKIQENEQISIDIFLNALIFIISITMSMVFSICSILSFSFIAIIIATVAVAALTTAYWVLENHLRPKRRKFCFDKMLFLNSELEKAKQKLQDLQNKKAKIAEEEFKNNQSIRTVNMRNSLENLRNYVHVYAYCKANWSEVFTYYKEGVLPQKLCGNGKEFSISELAMVEEAIKLTLERKDSKNPIENLSIQNSAYK